MTRYTNIAQSLKQSAQIYPFKRAVVYPASRDSSGRVLYSQLTFSQLDRQSDSLAAGLDSIGIGRGTRTILMVPPGMEFFLTVFAMFKVGAVPVVVDPGMGIDRMLQCLVQSRPKAFIGIEKAHVLRTLRPGFFKTVKRWVTVGRKWFWGGYTLNQLMNRFPGAPFKSVQTTENETAAIVFTTGSTGPAKGVIYTHGNFEAQIRQIQSHFQISPDEIDLPTFPLFALFDPALGMTAVIPDMDPTKPALVNPVKIVEAIENHGVTNMFASPALLNRVGKYGKKNGIKLPSLRRVVSAGAPVSPANIEQFSSMLSDDTQIHTPYGATEAVPIISIGSHEILSETKKLSEYGFGMCVGRPIGDTQVKLIKISDEPITRIQDLIEVPENDVGEIAVKGDLVTEHYFNDANADLLAKIPDTDGKIWHRMGDLGWKDSKGRIWFCGRKAHRVETGKETLFSIPVEAIFNNHEKVYRSALAGVGPKNCQIPVVFVEPFEKISDEKQFIRELSSLAHKNPLTAGIKYIFIEYKFPVDIRHNSKIFREKLAIKAQELISG
ncbi:fatty acid CoA ligase family protein [Desulfobacter postgatei]|jgi:acyl-CoA synthetase (AMP-forming)/AMP-acid ligase II|uniref:fatty acid CoA ligase family protein n=1 Tax=Desulfobacter postgatei TaxID=2293 RepID=UPI002A35AB44|nr:fatty acid CoA ligase family protein [Desulfobacter postgatei]MDX9964938.1 fatty acid CoA ligase family protein [Desulfobacter postgatei]